MRKYSFFFTVCMMFTVLAACTNPAGNEKTNVETKKISLTISAAASLQDSLTKIQELYSTEHPEVELTFNFGASGSLQQQISQGAPVDLFFSAAEDKMAILVKEGLINESDYVNLIKNNLVLIVSKDTSSSIYDFTDLTNLKGQKLAIGTPESVPAGKYAKEALESLKLWNQIENNIVFGKDVRQVLSYVETKNVEAGIVYETDALSSEKIQIVAKADPSTYTPIIYPLAIIKNSKHKQEAETFYDYLQSQEAFEVFEQDGFITD